MLTNLSAWLSGIWFDLSLVGGIFEKIANALPFVHAVKLAKALFFGKYENIIVHFTVVFVYGIIVTVIAIYCFIRQMKKQ